jgi:hypothetical protein
MTTPELIASYWTIADGTEPQSDHKVALEFLALRGSRTA